MTWIHHLFVRKMGSSWGPSQAGPANFVLVYAFTYNHYFLTIIIQGMELNLLTTLLSCNPFSNGVSVLLVVVNIGLWLHGTPPPPSNLSIFEHIRPMAFKWFRLISDIGLCLLTLAQLSALLTPWILATSSKVIRIAILFRAHILVRKLHLYGKWYLGNHWICDR